MDALTRRDGLRGARLLICTVAAALLMLAPAGAMTSPESSSTEASAAASKCAKGYERVKLRVGSKTKAKCVKKCKAGFVRKFTNRRAKTKCVAKPAAPAPPAGQT